QIATSKPGAGVRARTNWSARKSMNARPGLLVTLLATLAAAPLSAQAPGAKPAETPFEPTRVWAVHLTVPAREFEAMQPVNRWMFSLFSPPTPKAADGSARKV